MSANKVNTRPTLRVELPECPGQAPRPLCFADIFGNDNPVEMEIGCGKAKLLIARARSHIDRNFIGIDYIWKFIKIGHQRAEKRGLSNIRFIKAEARQVIGEFTPLESIAIFHIYFPDPWPKRRHQKRRLINSSFAELLHSRLEPNGRIEIATDDFDYFMAIQTAFAETVSLWSSIEQSIDQPLFEAEAKTNYELKFMAGGRMLHYLEVLK